MLMCDAAAAPVHSTVGGVVHFPGSAANAQDNCSWDKTVCRKEHPECYVICARPPELRLQVNMWHNRQCMLTLTHMVHR